MAPDAKRVVSDSSIIVRSLLARQLRSPPAHGATIGGPAVRHGPDAFQFDSAALAKYPPPQSWFLKRYWTQLPGAEALALLARCTGVRWIVVHPGTPARGAGWAALAGVRLRETFPGLAPAPDRLFEVIDRAPAACRDRLGQDAVTMDGTPVEHLAEPVGTLGVETLPATLEAGGETLVTVVLANAGPIAWPATARSSRDRFALELTWDGADAEWIALPADVRPGETRRFSVWIHHPARSGRHRLAVTAAQGDFLFEPINATTLALIQHRVEEALITWEPRIRVEEITLRLSDSARTRVRYRVLDEHSQSLPTAPAARATSSTRPATSWPLRSIDSS